MNHPTPTRFLYIYSLLRFISVSLFSLNIFSPSTLFLYTSSTFFLCVPLPLSFYIPLPLTFYMFHSLSICSTSTLFLYICSTPTLFLFSPLLHSFFCTYRIILKHSQQFPPLFHHFILSIPLPFYFYISFPSFYFFFFNLTTPLYNPLSSLSFSFVFQPFLFITFVITTCYFLSPSTHLTCL